MMQHLRIRTLSDSGCHPARSAVIYVRSLQISGHIDLSFVNNKSLQTPIILIPLPNLTLPYAAVTMCQTTAITVFIHCPHPGYITVSVCSPTITVDVYVTVYVYDSENVKIFFIHYVTNPLQNFFHAYVCPDYKWSDITYTLRLQHHP